MNKSAVADKNKYLESTFKRLKILFKKVWTSPYSDFYRNKFKASGFNSADIKNKDDWSKLPFLTRKCLEESDPWDRLYVPPKDAAMIKTSSGTTSGQPIIIFRKDYQTSEYLLLKQLRVKGLVSLAPYNRYYALVPELAKYNITFSAGDIHDMPRSAEIIKKLKIDAILGPPSILIIFNSYLKKSMPPDKIRLLLLAGTYTTQSEWENLKKLFPKAKVAQIYGLAESGPPDIGFPCLETIKNRSLYHLDDDYAFLEIVPWPKGEIILTTFSGALPLIRYRTGDLGAVVSKKCSCGIKSPLFMALGRINHDVVTLKGGAVKVDELERAIKKVLKINNPVFQFHIIEQTNFQHKLFLEIMMDGKLPKLTGMTDQIIADLIAIEILFAPHLSLFEAIKNGLFQPLRLSFVNKFPIQSKPKKIILHEL